MEDKFNELNEIYDVLGDFDGTFYGMEQICKLYRVGTIIVKVI